MSKLVEKMADAIDAHVREWAYTAATGWDEEKTAQLAARAALAVVMAEMREPSEAMFKAICPDDVTASALWRAMLAQFEKENAG